MKAQKLTVTVGVPAYNEENNIGNLLASVLSQHENGFEIESVVVVSDASTDGTIKEVKKIQDKRVRLIVGKERIGKPQRINQLLRLVHTEILVQLDGDVIVKHKDTIQNLIRPFMKGPSVHVVFGKVEPVRPTTFIEELSLFGFRIWEEAKHSLGGREDGRMGSGQIRAFSKSFFKKFRLPEEIGSAEDTYSFYFAKNSGFNIKYTKDAVVVFRLASSFDDYRRQMSRYLKNTDEMKKYFDVNLLQLYHTITLKVKIIALAKIMIKSKFYIVISYLFLHTLTYVVANFTKHTFLWDIASSTKRGVKMKAL